MTGSFFSKENINKARKILSENAPGIYEAMGGDFFASPETFNIFNQALLLEEFKGFFTRIEDQDTVFKEKLERYQELETMMNSLDKQRRFARGEEEEQLVAAVAKVDKEADQIVEELIAIIDIAENIAQELRGLLDKAPVPNVNVRKNDELAQQFINEVITFLTIETEKAIKKIALNLQIIQEMGPSPFHEVVLKQLAQEAEAVGEGDDDIDLNVVDIVRERVQGLLASDDEQVGKTVDAADDIESFEADEIDSISSNEPLENEIEDYDDEFLAAEAEEEIDDEGSVIPDVVPNYTSWKKFFETDDYDVHNLVFPFNNFFQSQYAQEHLPNLSRQAESLSGRGSLFTTIQLFVNEVTVNDYYYYLAESRTQTETVAKIFKIIFRWLNDHIKYSALDDDIFADLAEAVRAGEYADWNLGELVSGYYMQELERELEVEIEAEFDVDESQFDEEEEDEEREEEVFPEPTPIYLERVPRVNHEFSQARYDYLLKCHILWAVEELDRLVTNEGVMVDLTSSIEPNKANILFNGKLKKFEDRVDLVLERSRKVVQPLDYYQLVFLIIFFDYEQKRWPGSIKDNPRSLRKFRDQVFDQLDLLSK